AHAGGDDGIGGAVDGIGEPVHQIVPQIVEDAQVLEVLQTHLDVVDVGEILAEAPGNDQVGADVADDGHAEIEHIVGEPQGHSDLGQGGKHVEAEVDAGAQIPLLGAGVHKPPGDKKITAQRGNHVERIDRVAGSQGHIGHDPGQGGSAQQGQQGD